MPKPHYQVPIIECGEPLAPIPLECFAVVQPHPYAALGAPYGGHSPYRLRQTVVQRLLAAQARLQRDYPDWRIQIFDAYRPIAVQQFMVDHTYQQVLQAAGLAADRVSPAEQQRFMNQVYQFWAPPSPDPATPPPHSTGAALDVTLVDAEQQPLPMGSEIDEISERSYPDHFAQRSEARIFHRHRTCLATTMQSAGFCQHPNEWWHFSFGDQLWAWRQRQPQARYGAV
jgi:D-alanyl-D-alanine dipeptidase